MGRFSIGSRRSVRAGYVLVRCLVALLLVSHAALAEERAELLAESSFAEGVKLMHADRCVDAIAKFQESQHLDPASGTALNLAYCQARLGRVATAWLTYRQAITLAQAQNKPEHERMARTEAEKLEPDLPRLTLRIPETSNVVVTIELDGELLSPDLWSVPIPTDPGKHDVVVSVNHTLVWETTITVARRQHATLEVPRAKLESTSTPAARETPAAGPPPQAGAVPVRVPLRDTEPHTRRDSTRTWALVLGGVGGAAVVTGVALFVSARLEYDGVGDHCTGNACDDEGYAARTSAASRAKASYFVLAGGAALLGASIVLFATSGHASTTSVSAGATDSGWILSMRRIF